MTRWKMRSFGDDAVWFVPANDYIPVRDLGIFQPRRTEWRDHHHDYVHISFTEADRGQGDRVKQVGIPERTHCPTGAIPLQV